MKKSHFEMPPEATDPFAAFDYIPSKTMISHNANDKHYTLQILFNRESWEKFVSKTGANFYKAPIQDQTKTILQIINEGEGIVETGEAQLNARPIESLNPDNFKTHEERLKAFLDLAAPQTP